MTGQAIGEIQVFHPGDSMAAFAGEYRAFEVRDGCAWVVTRDSMYVFPLAHVAEIRLLGME